MLPILYLSNGPNRLIYDEDRAQVTGFLSVSQASGAIAATPDGLTTFEGQGNNVVRIDALTQQLEETTSPGSVSALAYDSANNQLYATIARSTQVDVLDPLTLATKSTILVGHNPMAIAINAAGTTAYVVDTDDNAVSVVDLNRGLTNSTFKVGTRPVSIVLRDFDATPCAGRPASVRVMPESSDCFVRTTTFGYRLAGTANVRPFGGGL